MHCLWQVHNMTASHPSHPKKDTNMREPILLHATAHSICPSHAGGRLKTDTAPHQGTPQGHNSELRGVLGGCHAEQAESAPNVFH